MKSKIEELSGKALDKIVPYTWTTLNSEEIKKLQEYLAQLIVRECISWCNAHARDDGTAQRIAEDIKKDFGVE
jgi:hypothetical protein